MKTIKILGAGISGLAAAINLAKAGFPVEIFERNRDIGMRFGGDVQGLENWSEKKDVLEDMRDMNLDVNFNASPFDYADISSGRENSMIHFTFPKPIFYLIKRGSMEDSLDQALLRQVRELGISIHFNVRQIPQDLDIIATGPQSSSLYGAVKGIVFTTDYQNTICGIINNQVAHKGYAYLLINNGYGCMCTCVFNELTKLNECFERTKLAFKELHPCSITNQQSVGGVAAFALRNTFERQGKLYIGESAGVQDFLLGFGIRNAITTAYLAAQSIINQTSYADAAIKKFRNRNKAGIVNRFVWEKFTANGLPYQIGRLYNKKNPFDFLYALYNYTFIQKALYPIARRYIANMYQG